jgi:hypothetical protein
MHQVPRLFVTALAVIALAYVGGIVSAQAPVEQIKLSEKHVQSFIAAHTDMADAFDKMTPETSDKSDKSDKSEKSETADLGQLDAIAKKFGFKDLGEYDVVATNIAMVMYGIDPQTKEFTDPPTLAKKELDEAIADTSVPEQERKQLVEELTEQLKKAQPIRHPGNIELVKKYYDQLEQVLQ